MESDNSCLLVNHIHSDGHRVYRRRWFVLLVVSLINVCNAGIWISFASIADLAAKFYQTTTDNINLFSTVFFVATIVVGFIAMYLIDRNGLLLGIYLGSFLTTIGIAIRTIVSSQLVIDLFGLSVNWQLTIALIGQIIAGCAQPFVLFTPTKVTELWFPVNQRAIATSIAGMSNPIGIVVGNLISPLFVQNYQNIPYLNTIWLTLSAIVSILTIAFIRSSKPPSPPSLSAEIISSTPYFKGIKELLTNKAYLLLLLYVGCAIGLFSSLITLIEQILAAKRYDDSFVGVCIAIMIASGVIGSAIISYVVDKTKQYTPATKVSIALTAISLIVLFISFRYPSIKAIILIICGIFGFFGFMTYPLGLELAIECTFPNVREATSCGLIMISGQLQAIVHVFIFTQLAKQTDHSTLDFSYSLICESCLVVFISCLFILLFTTDYKRLKCEQLSRIENNNFIS